MVVVMEVMEVQVEIHRCPPNSMDHQSANEMAEEEARDQGMVVRMVPSMTFRSSELR